MAKINLLALSKEQVVSMIQKLGTSSFDMSNLDSDIQSGFKANNDGTINIIHYAAWLIKEMHDE